MVGASYVATRATSCWPPSMSYVAPVRAVLVMTWMASAATSPGPTTPGREGRDGGCQRRAEPDADARVARPCAAEEQSSPARRRCKPSPTTCIAWSSPAPATPQSRLSQRHEHERNRLRRRCTGRQGSRARRAGASRPGHGLRRRDGRLHRARGVARPGAERRRRPPVLHRRVRVHHRTQHRRRTRPRAARDRTVVWAGAPARARRRPRHRRLRRRRPRPPCGRLPERPRRSSPRSGRTATPPAGTSRRGDERCSGRCWA